MISMKIINLKLKESVKVALEFDNVLPELLYDKDIQQINDTIIYQGNKERFLSELFEINISGDAERADDCKIILDGDLHRIKYIGNNMAHGTIIANGDVDLHVAAMMSGGHIIVNGDAESYAGREMTGGLLEIKGNVKEYCGSSYIGEWRGMNGGTIIIGGNCGKQLADCMLSGNIYIKGNCDILAGIHMSGGYIEIDGDVTSWPGGQMKKGIIVIKGNVGEVLQGFDYQESICHPLINGKYHVGQYDLYIGDSTTRGKGQLWVKR